MIPIIISGGAGSRLWPLSRQSDPKPFIKLADGLSLLQNTFLRATQLDNVDKVLTVTNEKIFFRMQDEYQQINANIVCDFILEPFGRNTAPAVLAACMMTARRYSADEIILILPADHLITDFVAFNAAVQQATKIADDGYLVTFGITPEYPEIGYGYIEADNQHRIHDGYLVKRFVEKPKLAVAKEYIASGNYLWNSGMFLGRVATFLQEFELHSPKLYNDVKYCLDSSSIDTYKQLNQIVHLDNATFESVENISIDYALFEKSNKTAVIPCAINWSDIGSWLSIAEALPKDENKNVVVGETILHNTSDCLIYSTNRIVATVDVKDLIIVDTPDAVLVADKHNSQNVKHIFERLKLMEHHTSEFHQTVHHVWGEVTILDSNIVYTISKVVIKPKGSFELQHGMGMGTGTGVDVGVQESHYYLTVVEGELIVINDTKREILSVMQSLSITLDGSLAGNRNSNGMNYRLENVTSANVVFIEIQYNYVSKGKGKVL
jgi:mannose-1-phosphate guanylyltransferase